MFSADARDKLLFVLKKIQIAVLPLIKLSLKVSNGIKFEKRLNIPSNPNLNKSAVLKN